MNVKMKQVFRFDSKVDALMFSLKLHDFLDVNPILQKDCKSVVVLVPEDNYLETLSIGSKILNEENIKADWINNYSVVMPQNYISVMYCILPVTKIGNVNWALMDDNCDIDVLLYVEKFKRYLGGKDVKIRYDVVGNGIEFLVNAERDEYDLVRSQCEGFDYAMKNHKPFVKTLFVEKIGIKYGLKDNLDLQSYVDRASFVRGIRNPDCLDISPKSSDFTKKDLGLFTTTYGSGRYDIKSVSNSKNSQIYEGIVIGVEEKEYLIDKKILTSKMVDSCNILSKVTIYNENLLIVVTDAIVKRSVAGVKFGNECIREALLSDMPHKNCEFKYQINDFYGRIANGTRLLHFASNTDFFEVFDLPDNWFIENGIVNLKVKVFDDYQYDKDDPNIDEIENILNESKKIIYTKKKKK